MILSETSFTHRLDHTYPGVNDNMCQQERFIEIQFQVVIIFLTRQCISSDRQIEKNDYNWKSN